MTGALDQLYFERALEQARRGIGGASPNPAVGAVVVKDGRILGEGYHHRAGADHAEALALLSAVDARGSSVYVTLEPCNHHGRTPPCSQKLIEAGVSRVVIGVLDPNPKTNETGVKALHAAGIVVDILDDIRAQRLIEPFARAIRMDRSYLALKMAMSLDGKIAAMRSARMTLTGESWRLYVRDLRIAHDAVMVGAGTVRVDDPQLTVRPAWHRLQPFTRIIACETDGVPAASRVFAELDDYARTLVLAPAGARKRFATLADVAEVVFVGDDDATTLDLSLAMRATRERGIQSILCEGGPTLGARLIAAGVVDRFYWAIAPRLLTSPEAVPVLAGADLTGLPGRMRFDTLEHVGEDVMLSGTFDRV